MHTATGQHPLRKACNDAEQRHDHDGYTPASDCTQRCACGSRKWKITVGGLLPPSVTCAGCASQNRTATAYERGRANG